MEISANRTTKLIESEMTFGNWNVDKGNSQGKAHLNAYFKVHYIWLRIKAWKIV